MSRVEYNGKTVNLEGLPSVKVFDRIKKNLMPCESVSLFNASGYKIDSFHTFKGVKQDPRFNRD